MQIEAVIRAEEEPIATPCDVAGDSTVPRYFERHPDVDVVYGHRVVIDQHGDETGRWVLPPHDAAALRWADYVPQETMFWRRRIWDAVGGTVISKLQGYRDLVRSISWSRDGMLATCSEDNTIKVWDAETG